MAEQNLERILLMLSGLVRETFMNRRELECTAQLGPEMEVRTCVVGSPETLG